MFQNWTYLAVLLVGFCCWTSVVVGVDSLTDPIEVKALQDIKKSLIDSNKILSNWNRGDPCTSNWTGVLCFDTTKEDGYLHVRELQLLNMNLSGQLSPELGRLSYLEILDFMWNSITGPIPKEIGNITSLFLLLLNGNRLTGSLPEELGYLPNLDRIQIDQNNISGPIPNSFANLNKTKHFHMNNNSISGQIPPELSRLPNLVHFLLDNNNLSGYLPQEFSDLPSLLILQLDNNNFEGTLIPDSYSNMSKLLKLSLRNCRLQGQIPDLSRIPKLGYLDLSSNQLNGSLPQGELSSNITTINLSKNYLTGTIPATFTSLPKLQRLLIANNSLDGSVPSTLWQSRTLNVNETLILDFENNNFINISGSPSLPPNVTLWLRGNPLCSNTHLDKICGSKNDEESNIQVSTYFPPECKPQSCPSPYEYSRSSPVPCFCAAPLLVGYRLKSPGFSYFRQYRATFEEYITQGLDLYPYQVDLDSFTWQKGPRLRMYLKLFPVYEDTGKTTKVFNISEVLRIRWKFTGWQVPDSDLFGPYELLNFTLLEPYQQMFRVTRKSGISVWVIIIVTCAISALGVLGCIIFMRKRKRRIQGKTDNSRDIFNKNNEGSKEDDMELLIYDLQTIAKATDNFADKNKLGEGGFGPVYKGTLMDGQEIAIKRLSKCSGQGIDEFKNEVILISKLQHRNLVKLLGCCTQRDERMLIYEYMPNKSLDYFIFDKTRRELLDWGKRIQIIGGIARGLLYLHQDSRLRIIHRDLKVGNVLLDKEMNPKISDFGLAKTFRGDQTRGETNRVVGTYGYMSPEYAVDGIFSIKSDIFSFGVLVLEMVSGKRNRGFCHTDHNHNLLGHAWRLWNEERAVELIDEQLDYSCTSSEILRCIHVGLLCVQQRPEDRPNMSTVALMLGGEGSLPRPRQPGFFTERNLTEPEITINEITISLLDPR